MLKFAKSKDEKLVNGSKDNGEVSDLDVRIMVKGGMGISKLFVGFGCRHTDG